MNEHETKNESKIRDAIAQAMERHVLLEIRYIDKHGKESVRLVRPDSVKGVVLFAYCMLRQAERAFVLSRVQEAALTDQPAPAVEETAPDHEEDELDWNELEVIPRHRKGVTDAEAEEFVRTVKWFSYIDHI